MKLQSYVDKKSLFSVPIILKINHKKTYKYQLNCDDKIPEQPSKYLK